MNKIFKTAKYRNAQVPSRASMAVVSEATGIPYTIIRLAKKKNLPGFNTANRLVWKLLKPEIERCFDDLVEALKNDSLGINEQIARRKLRLLDLQILEKEHNLLIPADVKAFALEVADTYKSAVKSATHDLAARCAGKSEIDCRIECQRSEDEIFGIVMSGETVKLSPQQ